MSSKYGAIARRARAQVKAKGVAVTFVGVAPGTLNEDTGRVTGELAIELPGYVVRVDGDPDRYEALSLIQSQAPTLLFTPTTFGRLPEPGMSVRFAGATYTVQDVDPVAPDGVAIMARIIIVGGGRALVRATLELEVPAFELSAELALLFSGDAEFTVSAFELEAAGHNGVALAYAPGSSLVGATFTRATTATYMAEV